MYVKFPTAHEVKDHHGKVIESYRAGEVVTFDEKSPNGRASAERWIRRGCEEVDEAEVKRLARIAAREKEDAPPQKDGPKDGLGGGGDGADDKHAGKGGPTPNKPLK